MKITFINSRLFLTVTLALGSFGSAALAADPVYTCHTDKQRLEIYQAQGGFSGQLTDLYGGVALNCVQADQAWSCVEAREGAGRVTVQANVSGKQVVLSREPVSSPSAPQGQPITSIINCL